MTTQFPVRLGPSERLDAAEKRIVAAAAETQERVKRVRQLTDDVLSGSGEFSKRTGSKDHHDS